MSNEQLRASARNRLDGIWGTAVTGTLVASLLGGSSALASILDFDFSFRYTSYALELLIITLIITLVFILYRIFVSNVVSIGYARFCLNIADESECNISDIFSGFHNFKKSFTVCLLTDLTIAFYTMIFIFPGIIAAYDYAMVPFIQAEHPEYSAKKCMEKSKNMMFTNRWDLFCLEMSFIGWAMLAGLTFGIGNLWLDPYVNTSRAIFYRNLLKTYTCTDSDASVNI